MTARMGYAEASEVSSREGLGTAGWEGGDRLRKTAVLPDSNAPMPHMTISIGVAVHQRGENAEALFRRADELLYRAKKEERDRVVC
jgi:diguanylate cyclase (GGDEF)-like protein